MEEDYIELEVISSNSTISLFHFKNSSSPPPQQQQQEPRSSEFEFQMLPNFIDRNNTSSTADELFYNGKLLPLDHLPITNKFLHVGKKIVDFEQSLSTPLCQSCHVSRKLNQQDYSIHDESSKRSKFSTSFGDFDQSLSTPFCESCHVSKKLNQKDISIHDESSKRSKFLHVGKSFGDFDQSLSTPLCQSCHVSRKLNQEDYSIHDESSKSHLVSKRFDDFDKSLSTPFCQSCHVSRKLNQEDYSRDDESSKRSKFSKSLGDFNQSLSTPLCQSCHVSKSFGDFDQSLSTPFCQSCHVSKKLINQEEHNYSTDDDDQTTSKTSRILHVSKSFDDFKQSFSTPPFVQSCHVSGELSNQEADYYFGYSTDGESSRKSKWPPKGSLTRKLKLIKQLSFDHSKLKCLINTSVNKLVAKKDFLGKSAFSGAIKRLLTAKASSRSKNSKVSIQEMDLLVRNKDVYVEVDDPIQAAIAHCKRTHHLQQKFNSRNGLGRSLSASKIMFEEQERQGLCRG